jgi:hypothetical protein
MYTMYTIHTYGKMSRILFTNAHLVFDIQIEGRQIHVI